MVNRDLNAFSLQWIKESQIASLSEQNSEAEAFQKICGSILNSKVYKDETGSDLKFMSFPLYGKDGSIDHYSFTDSESAIAECKKNKSAKNCISEIKKMHRKLATALSRKNAADTSYSPWFKENMRMYIFCTSCNISSAKEYQDIRSGINEMMINLAGIQGLSHLNDIRISVYCWNDLKEWILKSDDLMLEWVKTGIEGVEEIYRDARPYSGYHAYLLSDKFPYCSRDEFMDRHPDITDLPSEKKILATLLQNEESNTKGIIIHGQGGIGKTRFMRELALMAQTEGWRSYLVRTTDGFRQLNEVFKAGGKYLILVDYIEEFELFYQTIKGFARENHHFSFRFIVNCRSSYFKSNVNYLSDVFRPVDISDLSPSTHLYYTDLISKIIKDIPNLTDPDNSIFEYKPSFAVFIRYLYETNKEHYYTPAKFPDFRSWLIRRLELSFTGHNNKSYDKDLITKMFCCLPAFISGRNILEEAYMAELNILMSDGWFEKKVFNEKETVLSTIHDSITDELLIDYLSRYSHTLGNAIENHWVFAVNNDLIIGCMRSYERICDIDLLAGFNFYSLLQQIIERYPEKMKLAYWSVAFSTLVPLEYRVEVLVREFEILSPIVRSDEFGTMLAYFFETLYEKDISEELGINLAWLYDKWYHVNKDNYFNKNYSGYLVGHSIRFFGITSSIRIITEHYIRNAGINHGDYFIYSFWLHNGGEISLIEFPVIKWFEKFGDTKQVGVLMGYWLKEGGQKEVVSHLVKEWVGKYIDNEDYSKDLYTAIVGWLDAGGEKELVASYAHKWLEKFGDIDVLGGSMLRSCLEAGIDVFTLMPDMVKWLNKFADTDWSKNVTAAWVKAGGETTVVMPYVATWLKIFGRTENAIPVIIWWLQEQAEPEIIKQYVPGLLNEFIDNDHAVALICAWLTVYEDTAQIADAVKKWQSIFANTATDGIVLALWLKQGGDLSIVADAVFKWLNQYIEHDSAFSLLLNYLNAGGANRLIASFVTRWLKENGLTEKANQLINTWLDTGGEKALVEPFEIAWLEKFGKTKDAMGVIVCWLQAEGEPEIVKQYIPDLLDEFIDTDHAATLIGVWLIKGDDVALIADAVANWQSVFSNTMFNGIVLSQWLQRGGDFNIVADAALKWLEVFGEHENAFVLIKNSLDSGATNSLMAPFVIRWLDKFNDTNKVIQVIGSWLGSGGEKALVAPFITALLEKIQGSVEAFYVIKWWLGTAKETSAVEYAVVKWLEIWTDNKNVVLVFHYWVEAGGNMNVISPFVITWLNKVDVTKQTGYVFFWWLDKGGDTFVIKNSLEKWLKTQDVSDNEIIERILGLWLRSGGKSATVSFTLKSWLSKFWQNEEAGTLMNLWINAEGEKEIVSTAFEQWLKMYWNTALAGELMYWWMARYKDITTVSPFISQWLDKFEIPLTGMVLCMWLYTGEAPDKVSKYVKKWLATNKETLEVGYLIWAWLKESGDKTLVADNIPGWLVKFEDRIEAGPLMLVWLEQGGEVTVISDFVSRWLSKFGDTKLAIQIKDILEDKSDR